jgi:hypothetical protein
MGVFDVVLNVVGLWLLEGCRWCSVDGFDSSGINFIVLGGVIRVYLVVLLYVNQWHIDWGIWIKINSRPDLVGPEKRGPELGFRIADCQD